MATGTMTLTIQGGNDPAKLLPSEVFAQRLMETRKARGWTQAQLADRMAEAGRPIGRAALARIEAKERSLSLDEAIALIRVLRAVPSNLLSPPDEKQLALTSTIAVNGDGLRNWIRTGREILAWPATPSSEDLESLVERLKRSVTDYAVALIDANRVGDKDGVKEAYDLIVQAVERHREAVEEIRRTRKES